MSAKTNAEKWQRFKYLPMKPLGENGKMLTGSIENISLSRKVAGEGMVLLKNNDKVLPLKKGVKVALFGRGSVDYVKGGGGSGDTTVAYVMNMCQAMQEKEVEEKVTVFQPLCEFYTKQFEEEKKSRPWMMPGESTEPELPLELLDAASRESDVAVISICRHSREGYDRTGEVNDGDFYLSVKEQTMVSQVLDRFEKTIVILNVGGVIDTSWFYEDERIPAVLLAWQGGMEGAGAQADILCGDVNPSGKLVDTFAKSFADYPSSHNFHESKDYVCYTDDVFVGYRYFETIPGASERVNYPFGFGLSYTTFSMVCKAAEKVDGTVQLKIEVTNTGDISGREVVQVYSKAPECRLDMPKLQLRTFGKTKLLTPGESETLMFNVEIAELAAYDEKLASYVLFEGEHELVFGNSVRTVQNAYTLLVPEEQVICQLKNRCVPRKLPYRLKADGSTETLEISEYDKIYDPTDWPKRFLDYSTDCLIPNRNADPIPSERLTLKKVAKGEITLDTFIETLSDDELIMLTGGTPNRGVSDTSGIGGLDYLEIPAVMTADGPAGLRIEKNRGIYTTAWPVGVHLACTWDENILYQVGEAGAKEVKEMNIGVWLTPAINIHRSPLCGRNFEYYSEDPLLTGKLAAAKVRGIQSQNIAACVKHFCVNNKETNRLRTDSRLSERALREIYIKGFEIVVKESDVWAVMTSYNKMNGVYPSENKELIQGILREEWGFKGLVMTDWNNHAEPYRELLAGNSLRMSYGSFKRKKRAMEEGLITRKDLIPNVRHVLELLLHMD